jgi:hypothetical protein
MMPSHWPASSTRRRHPQAILATGLITSRLRWYFGALDGLRSWVRPTGGAFRRLIARFARVPESRRPLVSAG